MNEAHVEDARLIVRMAVEIGWVTRRMLELVDHDDPNVREVAEAVIARLEKVVLISKGMAPKKDFTSWGIAEEDR